MADLRADASSEPIEGFADRVSVNVGTAVGIHVSTPSPTFHVEAYRMGFYASIGARLVWQSPEVGGGVAPQPVLDPVTHMVECHWPVSVTVSPDATWPPGDYLRKLVGLSGGQRYVPLTVRDDASTSAFVIQNSVTTWQAYNTWGRLRPLHGT